MVQVGGEVDAFCNRCQLELAHTVIAMVGGRPVKVECNTCHSVHKFKVGAAGAVRMPSTPRTPRSLTSFDSLLAARNGAQAKKYSPKSTFTVDEVIEHPNFGLGFVSALKDGGKIEVTFRTAIKTLIHGKP
jgi:hypothetical protein